MHIFPQHFVFPHHLGFDPSTLALRGLQIVWINILLSGDNAVVIALACRQLDTHQRKWAIVGGSSVAVVLRIVLTFFVVALLGLPYIKLLSGLLLLWIAFDLLRSHDDGQVEAAGSIWGAIRTIALADIVMSLDNVVAVAAAAKNSMPLIVFGIALSVPLIVFGSTFILLLLKRFPALVVAGAALLGFVAGEIIATDPILARVFHGLPQNIEPLMGAVGAALVLGVAVMLWCARWLRRRRMALMPRPGEAARLNAQDES